MHTTHGVCSRAYLVCRQESECHSHNSFIRAFVPSEGNLRVKNTALYLQARKVSGAIRVNKHNCKDCPKADGKQRLNGIENRCEAWFKLHFIGCCSLKRRDCFTVCFHTVGSCCLFCVHSRILPKKEWPPHLIVFEAWRLPLNCRTWVRNMAWLAVGLLCILHGSEPRLHLQIQRGQISFPSTSLSLPFPWYLEIGFSVYWLVSVFSCSPPLTVNF